MRLWPEVICHYNSLTLGHESGLMKDAKNRNGIQRIDVFEVTINEIEITIGFVTVK